jgi:hypothetical protein
VVAVDGDEGERDFAEGDFDGLGLEFGMVVLAVNEGLLLFGEVTGQQDFGVQGGEEGGEFGGRGLEEDGEGACGGVLAGAS